MKILFIVNCSNFFVSHFLKLAQHLKMNNHEIFIAAGNDIKKDVLIKDFKFVRYSLSRSGKNLFYESRTLYEINKLILNCDADIIHLLTIKPILYGCLVAKFNPFIKSKIVTSITGLGSACIAKGTLEKITWSIIKVIYRVVFTNPLIKVIFENSDDKSFFISNKISSVNNSFIVNGAGVDLTEFSPRIATNKTTIVILVARLLRDKGIFEYIKAGRILKAKNINVKLLLVGDIDNDNPTSLSRSEVIKADNDGYIKWVGYKNNIAKYNNQSHIACLPSYREGRPKSLIEAMASGLAIITTNVPGCKQMVENGVNGLLIPEKNEYALAIAIQKLVEDRELTLKMGSESRRIAEEIYGYDSILKSFDDIYKSN